MNKKTIKWLVLGIAIIYVISPIDLLPDPFILDDIAVAAGSIYYFWRG